MRHKYVMMYRNAETDRGLAGETEIEADYVRFEGPLVVFISYPTLRSEPYILLAVPASEVLMLRQVS